MIVSDDDDRISAVPSAVSSEHRHHRDQHRDAVLALDRRHSRSRFMLRGDTWNRIS